MTKRQTTQTQPENLSKQGKQWLSEVDWDLLEQLDQEEEGQSIPMQDSTENPQESQASSPSGFRDLKMDPSPGVLSPLPIKNK